MRRQMSTAPARRGPPLTRRAERQSGGGGLGRRDRPCDVPVMMHGVVDVAAYDLLDRLLTSLRVHQHCPGGFGQAHRITPIAFCTSK